MKLNCDQVFDVLTRGPFPSGAASDSAVELHLTLCGECARLAAALRPAIELFQEAIEPDEGRDLPSYWGDVSVETAERTRAVAEPFEPAPPSKPVARSRRGSAWRSREVWRWAPAVAAGLLLGAWFSTLPAQRTNAPGTPAARPDHLANGTSQPPPTLVAAQPRDQGSGWLRVPLACAKDEAEPGSESSAGSTIWVDRRLTELACCTRCHNAQHDASVPKYATVNVRQQCWMCHQE